MKTKIGQYILIGVVAIFLVKDLYKYFNNTVTKEQLIDKVITLDSLYDKLSYDTIGINKIIVDTIIEPTDSISPNLHLKLKGALKKACHFDTLQRIHESKAYPKHLLNKWSEERLNIKLKCNDSTKYFN